MGEIPPQGDQKQFGEPRPINRKLLPIGIDAIKKSLSRIASDPSGEKLAPIKMIHVRANDPHYAELMSNFFGLYQNAMISVGENKHRSYYYGVTTFFDIVEEQAKQTGAEIPTIVVDESIERNDANTIWRNERDALYKIVDRYEHLHPNNIEGIAEQRMIDLTNETSGDTVLGILLRKYVSNYSGREAFLVGFIFAYDTMRMMFEMQEKDRVVTKPEQPDRTTVKTELETWKDDPEVAELHKIFDLLPPVEPNELDLEIEIDTSNLGGVDFANGMADLELFLYEQGRQQGQN